MKTKTIIILFSIVLFVGLTVIPGRLVYGKTQGIEETFGKLPLYFVENKGQTDNSVSYYIQGRDKTIYFTSEGITMALTSREKMQDATEKFKRNTMSRFFNGLDSDDSMFSNQRWVIKLDFVGADRKVKPVGLEKTDAIVSYFKGPSENWKTGLPTYSSIIYRNLWPGIDLIYTGTVNAMKYTFVVHPGANPEQIQFAYRGISSLRKTDSGQLEVTTPGDSFHDDCPSAYQETDGKHEEIDVSYCVKSSCSSSGDSQYGFSIGEYDKNKTLIIDPVVFVYCGYVGGRGDDAGWGFGIAVDSSGNAYGSGTSSSTEASFPVFVGPDLTYNGGTLDMFVAKVNPAGTALVYCGYIGGSEWEAAHKIVVDAAGAAYITGQTLSDETTFPVTVGPDLTYNGGGLDAFVAKVNPSGATLDYCGYIGGDSAEEGYDIAIDSAGNAYATGITASDETTFPVTVGPSLVTKGGGDAWVAKVNPSGSAFVYCGFIGGANGDWGFGIDVDSAGSAYVSGFTQSNETSFPVTVGPDLTFNGGTNDAFIVKINPAGTALMYAGYIGGAGDDQSLGVAVDSAGSAYVMGPTDSNEATFPVTVGPDLTYNGGIHDTYIAKVNTAGTGFIYLGYVGGTGDDFPLDIALNNTGNAYISGWTTSDETSFPVAWGPDLTFNGDHDAYLVRVNVAGTSLDSAGYIGGAGSDAGFGIAVDDKGGIYMTGSTNSTEATFPVLIGPDLTFNGGSNDAFMLKIGFTPTETPTIPVTNTPTTTPTPTPPPTVFCCWEQGNNAGCVLNSTARDEHPTLTSDDRYLFFTSLRAGGSGRKDLWYSERIGPREEDWSAPVNLGASINTDMDEGGPSITGDMLHLYFQAYNKTVSNFDLYFSDWNKVTSSWNPRIHLGWMINSDLHNDRHPHIWRNGTILYFDSDRPGGTGGVDLWMTRKLRGLWMPPEPLPNPINTASYEAAPYVYETGPVRYLYFESERGGTSKLYRSEWDPVAGQWGTPMLMCREFSNALHPYINSTGSELFFHSILVGGCGDMDIWISKCLPSPTPAGTWFSQTPTSTPTYLPVVPVTPKTKTALILIFVSVCLLVVAIERGYMINELI